MSPRGIGVALLFLGSELIGYLLGEWFHGLFMKAIPAAATSSFNQGAAHLAFILYGAVTGLVIFIWALLAATFARFFGSRRPAKAGPALPTGAPPPPKPAA
jgi:hypothetical protein